MEWISVKDRLPIQTEEADSFGEMRMISERVLAVSTSRDGKQYIGFDYFINGEWQSEIEDEDGCTREQPYGWLVTHWAPIILPKP